MPYEFEDYGLDFSKTVNGEIFPPPSPNLKLVFVVPIRGEITNGNFFSLLKDMMRQTATKSTFELILVVNNGTNYRFEGENKQIIAIVKYLNDLGPLPYTEPQDQWKIELLGSAKEQGIRVSVIPRLGRYQSMNIEVFRQIGNHFAVERLRNSEYGLNGAVSVLDADTRITANTAKTIIDQFVNQPEVGMLTISLDMYPGEGGERIWLTHSFERLDLLLNRLNNLGKSPNFHPWHVIRASELKLPDVNTLNARDSEYVLLHHKDYHTTTDHHEEIAMPPSVSYITQDRARPVGVGGITGYARFTEIESDIQPGIMLLHPLESLIRNDYLDTLDRRSGIWQQLLKLYEDTFGHTFDISAYRREAGYKIHRVKAKYLGRAWYTTIITLMKGVSPSEIDELESIVAISIRAERLRHELFRNKARLFLRQCFNYFKSNRENKTPLTTAIAQSFIPLHEKPFFTAFFGKSDWLVTMINQMFDLYHGLDPSQEFDDFIDNFENLFPEFLLRFDETECGETNGYLLGLCRYIEEVAHNLEEFPSSAKFWGFNSTSPALPPHTESASS